MITPEMSRLPAAATNSAMTEANLEKRLGDLERRHDKTRGLLVNALSLAVMGLVGFYYKPEGVHAAILGFYGGFFVPGLLSSWLLREDRLRQPMSRFDRMCMAAAITGLLVLALVTVVFFLHPLKRFGP